MVESGLESLSAGASEPKRDSRFAKRSKMTFPCTTSFKAFPHVYAWIIYVSTENWYPIWYGCFRNADFLLHASCTPRVLPPTMKSHVCYFWKPMRSLCQETTSENTLGETMSTLLLWRKKKCRRNARPLAHSLVLYGL